MSHLAGDLTREDSGSGEQRKDWCCSDNELERAPAAATEILLLCSTDMGYMGYMGYIYGGHNGICILSWLRCSASCSTTVNEYLHTQRNVEHGEYGRFVF